VLASVHDLNVAQQISFGVLATAMVLSALRMATTKNLVHAALYLVVVLAGTAGIYILLAAEFVAVTQVLVYIGAIVVLMLFGLFLTRAPIGKAQDLDNDQRWLAAIVSIFLLGVLVAVLQRAFKGQHVAPQTIGRTADIGIAIFKDYVIPFVGRPGGRGRHCPKGLGALLNEYLFLAALLFCVGVYGALARKNAVLVLMSIELILNAVNINLIAFGAFTNNLAGQIFALFVIAVAAAEVGVGLAIVLLIYRNRHSVDLDDVDLMKG
jgi:NADH:ubiquinone oxidoreductase subunit K/NADH:ubiquinone oxidoreductase subunit 6 (subunit J)